MLIHLTNSKGTYNVTELAINIKWSGDKRQAARTLALTVITSPTDKNIPIVDWSMGGIVQAFENGEKIFHGKIVNRSKSIEGSTMTITCHDNGRLLKRNKVLKRYEKKTPEYIAEQLANEYKVPIGSLVKTGVAITRLFLSGNDNVYDVIRTAYTIAAKTTKKKYHIGFRGEKLFITEMDVSNRTLVIQGKSNLISANTTESIESIVSEVQIYSKDDTLVRTVKDTDREKMYDFIREIVKQTKDDDKAAEAQKIIDEGDLKQTISIDAIGNIANVSGGTVVVQEPYTGLCGLFYIESDVHEWKKGQYYNKLTLNIKNIIDEKEVGTLPNADGSKTKAKGTGTVSPSSKNFWWEKEEKVAVGPSVGGTIHSAGLSH